MGPPGLRLRRREWLGCRTLVKDPVEFLAALVGFFHHPLGKTFFVDLPLAAFPYERYRLPSSESVLNLKRSDVAFYLFISQPYRLLMFGKECLVLDDLINRNATGLCLRLIHFHRRVRKQDLHRRDI